MKAIATILALSSLSVSAQPTTTAVYFGYGQAGANHWLVDQVMRTVLERPQFATAARRDAQVLEVTVLDKISRDSGENSTGFSFTLGFYRGGDRLGEASEYCHTNKLADCGDQLAADIISADAIHH